MKVLSITGIIFLLSLSVLISIDFLMGIKLSSEFVRFRNPFFVMDPGEYVMIGLLFMIIIGHQIFYHFQNKPNKR